MGRWFKNKDGSLAWSHYSLKFYEKEQEKFREAYQKKLTMQETRMVFNKLVRHYKLSWIRLSFNGRRHGGIAYSSFIEIGSIPSFGILCHEIAHIIDRKKRGKSKHDKKLMKIIDRVVNYCKKRNWWEEELKRRTEIKIKPEPTKEELRLKKLEKRKADLIRYKKKLHYYNILYSNKIKKANRSIAMFERIIKKNF